MKLRKIIIPVLVCGLLFTACKKKQAPAKESAPKKETPPATETVWLPTTYTYVKDGVTQVDTYTYDPNGNLIRLVKTAGNQVVYQGDFTFNTDNQPLSGQQIWYDDDAILQLRSTTYVYDGKTLLSRETTTDDAGGIHRTTVVCNYGSNGTLGEELIYQDGKLQQQISYLYDDTGRLAHRTVTENGTEITVYTYHYAESSTGTVGQVICRRNGTEFYRENTIYREDRQPEKFSRIHADGSLEETCYSYDEKGICTKITESVNGQPPVQIILAYDENGNLSSEICQLEGAELWRKAYTNFSMTVSPERAKELKNQQAVLLG